MNAKNAAKPRVGWGAFVCATLLFAGCGAPDASSPDTPVAPEEESLQPAPTSVVDPLVSMNTALQDEYRAQATYAQVLIDLGDVVPFSKIVEAEATHIAAISALFTSRELAVPGSELGEAPTYDTRLAACEAAVIGETGNIAIYDGLLLLELPNDVRNVFTNLRLASLEQHLPAFENCVESATADLEEPAMPEGEVLGEALTTVLQAELLMQATYDQVLADLGDMNPFSNIADAEGRHVGSIETLFTTRGLPLPTMSGGDLTTFDTRLAACAAAVDMEQATVAMYDVLLSGQWPNDVLTVFANLRLASLQQHLPAFQKCA